MYQGNKVGAILLMAGQGSRLGAEIPKQFLVLGRKRVYLHTLSVFYEAEIFDEIVLVCHPHWLDIVAGEVSFGTIVEGAVTRQESTYRGLKGFTQKPDIVVVHDAVRPFVSKEILLKNVEQAILHNAVDTCITMPYAYAPQGTMIESIPKREEYQRGQTPQTFRYEWLF